MTLVRFTGPDGEVTERHGAPGDRLLDVAQADGQPLEGTCDGDMACATCHVIVAPEDFARLPPASADEEDMLDMVANATRTSRLSCQIRIDAGWVRLAVRIPS